MNKCIELEIESLEYFVEMKQYDDFLTSLMEGWYEQEIPNGQD
jgi:hypothetical protein